MDYKEFFITDNKSGWKCVESKLKNKHSDIHDLIINFSKEKNLTHIKFIQQIWHFIHGVEGIPKCKECGGKVKFLRLNSGYQTFCSVKCSNKNKDKIQKNKETIINKYNVDCTLKIPDVIKRTKGKNIKNYGVDNPLKSPKLQNTIKELNLKKYGTITPAKNSKIQDKIKTTNLTRYGESSHLKSKIIQNKIKKTNLEKYGVENVFASEKIQNKIHNTNMVRYGDKNIFKTDYFKEFKIIKKSKIEKEICEKINGENSFNFMGKEFDIKINDDLFEIDGDYYHSTMLKHLNLIQLNNAINDYEKISLINNSQYNLYKVKVSDVLKLSDININNLKNINYRPNYTLTYNQKIITKEYFKQYIKNKGKDKLLKYVPLLLKFIRTFKPDFPFPDTNYYNLNEIIKYIGDYNLDKIYNNSNQEFINTGLNTGNMFLKSIFKSYWYSSYKNNLSPIDIWDDDKKMLKIIKYRIGLNNSNEIYDFSLKNLIKGISAIRGTVSFFKPMVAAAIYKYYLNGIKSPTVFDPCCGFGGRLLGFKSIYPFGTYIGCEPNNTTYNELLHLSKNFNNIKIYNNKLENFNDDINYDIAFTSIPYFDLENYNNGITYENFEMWKNTFIKKLLTFPKLIINMNYELCTKLNLTQYIDNYLTNYPTHFNKTKIKKREVILKINF